MESLTLCFIEAHFNYMNPLFEVHGVVVVVVVNRDPRLRLARFTVLAGYGGDPPHTPRGLVDGDDARSTTTVALAT